MKILMVGLGGIGQRHVRNLRALMGQPAEILAWRVRRLSRVVTPTLQSDESRDVEQEYGIRVFDTLESALAEQPQIAFICNPTSLHVPAALACARAGCDLFLEKPVSHNLDGLARLLSAVEERRRVAMVGYQLRFHPCFLALQRTVRDGSLGGLLAARATVGEYLPGWHPYEDYRQTYASRADLGGGAILTQIHEFDYLYALFGVPRRLFSLGGHWSDLEIDVEDVASTLMEFRFAERPIAVHLQQDYVQRPPSRGCEIVGDRGKLAMDLAALSVTRYDRDGKVAQTERWEGFDRNQLFLDELRHFLECVETRQKPVVDLRDGISSLRMALAAKESIATGRVIDLGAELGTDIAAIAEAPSRRNA
jgi:predicted dehydrogenase